jgi:hypothetical protein
MGDARLTCSMPNGSIFPPGFFTRCPLNGASERGLGGLGARFPPVTAGTAIAAVTSWLEAYL